MALQRGCRLTFHLTLAILFLISRSSSLPSQPTATNSPLWLNVTTATNSSTSSSLFSLTSTSLSSSSVSVPPLLSSSSSASSLSLAAVSGNLPESSSVGGQSLANRTTSRTTTSSHKTNHNCTISATTSYSCQYGASATLLYFLSTSIVVPTVTVSWGYTIGNNESWTLTNIDSSLAAAATAAVPAAQRSGVGTVGYADQAEIVFGTTEKACEPGVARSLAISSPASYLVVDKFILTTTNPCHTRTEDNLSINKNQFFLELPQSALPNGPQAISEGQILSIPYVDTVIHSMYSDFPLCTGALTVLPDPKVVVSIGTVLSLSPTVCDPSDCPDIPSYCGNIVLYRGNTTITGGDDAYADSKTVLTALTSGGSGNTVTALAASAGGSPDAPAIQTATETNHVSGLAIAPQTATAPGDAGATTIAFTVPPEVHDISTVVFTTPAAEGDGETTTAVTESVLPFGIDTISRPSAEQTQVASPGGSGFEEGGTPSQAVTFTVGTATYTAHSGGASIGNDFITAGGSAITTGNAVISVNSQGVVVSSLTQSDSPQNPDTDSDIRSGIDMTFSSNPVVATYAFNSAGPTASGAVVSIGSGPASTLALSNGNLVVGSQTLSNGGSAATVNGQTISVGSSGIIVDGNTYAVSVLTSPTISGAVVTLGGSTFTASATGSNEFVIGSQTISEGGPAATVNGQVVSVGSGDIIVGDSTIAISTLSQGSAAGPAQAVFTIGSNVYTETAGSNLVIGSETLSIGGPAATVSGEVVSLAPNGVILSHASSSLSTSPPQTTSGVVFTLLHSTITDIEGSTLVIGGQTLTPGGQAATIGGEYISVGSSGVVLGSSTLSYSALATSSTAKPTPNIGLTMMPRMWLLWAGALGVVIWIWT